MIDSVDIFLNRLYTSNDPLCMEAGSTIEKQMREISRLREANRSVSLASRYMVESLFEIIETAKARDKTPPSTGLDRVRELSLRLKECGEIATDTLRLETVIRALEDMKD